MIKEAVTVTPDAKDYIKGILNKLNKPYLFFGIKGGGCAGFEYYWEPMDANDMKDLGTEDKDERIVLGDGQRLIVDHLSIMYIIGSVIDFEVDISGSRLVVKNPGAVSACGCGTSVSFQ
jgi:iron-sulfur cluster insertion protein